MPMRIFKAKKTNGENDPHVTNNDYPGLYGDADKSSNVMQTRYLRLIKAEYSLLVVASGMSMGWNVGPIFYVFNALVFLLAVAILLYRSSKKPEQEWYRARAVAESIKTSTWRFMMRAEPFENAESLQEPKAKFRNFLKEIIKADKPIYSGSNSLSAAEDQVTRKMEEIRTWNLDRRKELYRKERIDDQRRWYAKKAKSNARHSMGWVVGTVTVYIAAIATTLLRIAYPDWQLWPTEPLIVIAASFVGWIQMKKFNELASAYTLAAHEIGIIQTRHDEVEDEQTFSEFVNEAELAFSREHTQWIARQQHG